MCPLGFTGKDRRARYASNRSTLTGVEQCIVEIYRRIGSLMEATAPRRLQNKSVPDFVGPDFCVSPPFEISR